MKIGLIGDLHGDQVEKFSEIERYLEISEPEWRSRRTSQFQNFGNWNFGIWRNSDSRTRGNPESIVRTGTCQLSSRTSGILYGSEGY